MGEEDGVEVKAGPSPLLQMFSVAAIAAGVQFGWALQLSLLTPYIQQLGVPHTWSSFVWLCGPVSGMIVQPIVGYTSDRLKTRFGRRKPFICMGTMLICLSVLLIGYAADLGVRVGDSIDREIKPRAVAFFVIGFWILDMSNNMVQDPTRAFLADLSKHDHRKMRISNALFAFFMAIGNISGYAAGANNNLYKFLPFTKTPACDIYCANLKTCFFIDIVFVLILVTFALATVPEPTPEENPRHADPITEQLKSSIKNIGRPMWILFLVTALNWIAWFPFLTYNTDWVGTEVYGGKVDGSSKEKSVYEIGVRAGSLGLMLTAVACGVTSVSIDPLSKLFGGAKKLWGVVNFILAICLGMTVWVTKAAEYRRKNMVPGSMPPRGIKIATLSLFAATGIPQAATYSIPFAVASMFSSDSGAGHGLSLGVTNLAIVIPQMLVAAISGPIDKVFGGSNLPAFVLGALSAVLSAICALTILPAPSSGT